MKESYGGQNQQETEVEEVDLLGNKTIHVIETRFRDITWNEKLLTRWLKQFYGVEVELKENSDGTFSLSPDTIPSGTPELPPGYGLKGGYARNLFRAALHIPLEKPRDIDIVYFGDTEQDPQVADDLARRYMPDDYEFGYGVEGLEKDYFETRDFTWNEVFYMNGNVVFSKQCLLDTMRNIVRISEYEKQESYNGLPFFVKPKLLAKAIRLMATARAYGSRNVALSHDVSDMIEYGVDYWHLALHLSRAFEQGHAVASEYTGELIDRGLLPPDLVDPIKALHFFSEETDFLFRAEAADILKRELDIHSELTNRNDDYSQYGEYSRVTPFWHPQKY